MPPPLDTLIIGGGLSGLSTAYHLAKAGQSIAVLEKGDHVGGAIRSERKGDWLAEWGPNSINVTEPEVDAIIADLGLENDVVLANTEARKRFLVRKQESVAAPMSPGEFFSTPLFSAGSKLRLMSEPMRRKRPATEGEESLADFVRRRLGNEALTYGAEPFVSGIFAGDPEKLSVRHAFPKLAEFEESAGSLLKGGKAFAKAKREAHPDFKSRMIAFREGLGQLPERLAARLPEGALSTGVSLTNIERANDHSWTVTYRDSTQRETSLTARNLVSAIPTHSLDRLPFPAELHRALHPLAAIEYPPVSGLALGFQRGQVAHALDGFGMLVPKAEGFGILGTIFSSTLFPGRAPDGHVLLTVFIGGARQPQKALLPESELERHVLEDLNTLLGVGGEPVFRHHIRWPRAIPQYNLGYAGHLETMDQVEQAYPGLHLTGNYRGGIAAWQCLVNGKRLAERITEAS